MNVLELFAGIGGLGLGLERAGMTVVGQVEINPFCQRVLAKYWPEVPRHDDVRTAPNWWAARTRPAVHVVAGGFPCQPASLSGLGLGTSDERWLWPAMATVIGAVRPDWVIAENVPGLRRRGLSDVLRDLAGLGYRARAGTISACAMGAPHTRERLFVLAHAEGVGCGSGRDHGAVDAAGGAGPPAPGRAGWLPEPRVARVADGVPRRLVRDQLRAYGNAVVPQVAEHVGRLVMAAAGELVPA